MLTSRVVGLRGFKGVAVSVSPGLVERTGLELGVLGNAGPR